MNVPESAAGRSGTCKKCGEKITVPALQVLPVTVSQPRVQTVQATSKTWKLLQLVGGLGAVASVSFGMIQGISAQPGTNVTGYIVGSFLLFCLSVSVMMIGRLGAWWFHG